MREVCIGDPGPGQRGQKLTKARMAGDLDQVVECLPNKFKALRPNPKLPKQKQNLNDLSFRAVKVKSIFLRKYRNPSNPLLLDVK
jgi:hypothetical protein